MNILKIGFSAGSLGKSLGSEEAPDAIQERLKKFYLNEDLKSSQIEFKDVKVDKNNIEATNENIVKAVGDAAHMIVLGGDHSITYSSFKAFAEKNENPGIIVFDAHADMMNDFRPPTHEDYLRVLIEDGLVKPENVIVVGTRNIHENEKSFINKNKIKIFSMKEIAFQGKEDVCDAVMAASRSFGSLYLSVDIDVLDPSFAPGVAYPEPAGLSTRELLYFIQRIKLLPNLKMADIVEVIPKKDVSGLTVSAAAKILRELC